MFPSVISNATLAQDGNGNATIITGTGGALHRFPGTGITLTVGEGLAVRWDNGRFCVTDNGTLRERQILWNEDCGR